VDVEAAARTWIDGWSRAWPAKDADAVAALYADDAVFRSQPFREAHRGPAGARDYASWAFSEQEDVEFWFGEPVLGDDRAAVEYWAVIAFGGRAETIAGVAVLRFAADGRVAEQRDYWSPREGRHEPPADWGR
jgi:ketosteroid isomerase-like protein